MRPNRFIFLAVTVFAALFTSCASKFSAAQREALSTVAIAKTEMGPDAYQEPYGGDEEARDRAARSGGSGGAIGVLIASAVANGISGTQNSMFHKKCASCFPAIQRNTPNNLNVTVHDGLRRAMKADHFFGPRLRESSGNVVTSTVTSYNLKRVSKEGDELLFSPRVDVHFALKDATGKELFVTTCQGVAGSQARITEYANSPAKSKTGYYQATNNAVDAFMAELAKKTAD